MEPMVGGFGDGDRGNCGSGCVHRNRRKDSDFCGGGGVVEESNLVHDALTPPLVAFRTHRALARLPTQTVSLFRWQ